MKKILLLFLFVVLVSEIVISQTITFDKSINTNSATQVLQTNDGGYLLNCVGGIYGYNPKIIKTNQNGYIDWEKDYPIYKPAKYLCKTIDGDYAATGSSLFTEQNVCLVKFDQNFDTLWIKTFGPGEGQSVIQLPDSNYLISSFTGTKYYVIKTDSYGSLIWMKEIPTSPSLTPSYLVNLNDGNFLFGKRSLILKMNSDADTIWTKTNVGINYSTLSNDEHILVATQSTFNKFDLDGNQIWQKNVGNIKSIAQTSEGNYVCLQGIFGAPSSCNLLLVDTSGKIISQYPFENSGEYILNTNDGGFAVCGLTKQTYNFLYTWLLKIDANFNYTAINLEQPLDGTNMNLFSEYPITWSSNNINYINIDYSTDNQVTWTTIINYYPADTELFNWTLPVMPAGNLFIRISDSFKPEVFDRSDPPQNAINYQATDFISANEIFMWLGNNGMNSHDPRTDGSGFFWPAGENATISAIFADGLVWGGKVNGEIRVNGSTYRYGLTPGYILPTGLPSDPFEVKSKIFKLKKDWQYLPPSPERDRYEFDFLNWPVDVGAPWDDINDDGIYTPGIDNPKFLGDETLFFVSNDLDTLNSLFTYGSNPIGLEIQSSTFGYNNELLKDVVFKKFKIINKSNVDITDMYFTYWADDDMGDASDDFEGFDSTLNMGYCYNGDNDDNGYYGTPPPAVGHMIVQGPIIPSVIGDSARFGDGWKKGFNNLGMTATGMIMKTSILWPNDPDLGNYAGTLQFYNMMKGLQQDGSSIINPITGQPTIWPLSGDPVLGTGWYEGNGWPGGPIPSDRRYHVPTGPFNMAPSDIQEIVIAILMKKGTDNINSITELKNYAAQIQHWYDNDLVTDAEEINTPIPTEFSLSQNYPNPFNPVTTINYSIPTSPFNPSPYKGEGQRERLVTLKVYDILGNEIATLVNEEKPAGNYEIKFDATKLSSGVYFYRLKAGSFIQTNKMVLIK